MMQGLFLLFFCFVCIVLSDSYQTCFVSDYRAVVQNCFSQTLNKKLDFEMMNDENERGIRTSLCYFLSVSEIIAGNLEC